MTYNVGDEDLRLDGDYVKLEEGGGGGDGGVTCLAGTSPSCLDGCGGGRRPLWWWVRAVLVVLFVGALGLVTFKWIGPFLMDKVKFLMKYTISWVFYFLHPDWNFRNLSLCTCIYVFPLLLVCFVCVF